MATWHQMKAHGAAMANLYSVPAKGHRVVVNHPNALAYSNHFNRKRDAIRFATKTGGTIISAARNVASREPSNALPVIFRVYRGELCAYFPTERFDNRGNITCYAHIGQHGGACPSFLQKGRAAKPAEYAALLAELRGIYESGDSEHIPLKVYRRATGKATLRRL